MPHTFLEEKKKSRPMDEQAEFVMSFIKHSREQRDDLENIWDEVEENFLVRSAADSSLRSTRYPLGTSANTARSYSVLKDPETHQELMVLVSKLALALFPEDSFIQTTAVGFEDLYKSQTGNKLLEHCHSLPGQYMAFIRWLLGICIYGTGVMEMFWDFVEQPRTAQVSQIDPFTGEEFSVPQTVISTIWDDPRLQSRDIRDFFPDPSSESMLESKGAGSRFRITADVAQDRGDEGIYRRSAVKRALQDFHGPADAQEQEDHTSENMADLSHRKDSFTEHHEMTGYRYVGQVPWKTEDDLDVREIVVLQGHTVSSRAWNRALPWYDGRIIPRLGSFYGIGPGEIIKSDQDLVDTLKMMMADAVVKETHPPFIYDRNANVKISKLMRFSPNVPVPSDRVDAVETLNYNANLSDSFATYVGTKSGMREATGVLGSVQGLGLGSKRFSASEAVQTFEEARDRPELFASILEKDALPEIGRGMLELYQEFLNDPEELANRVGESQAVVSLADISGRFDIRYVGSRTATRVQEIEAFREINAAAASNPIALQVTPWIDVIRKYYKAIGAPEIAAQVGNEQLMKLHILLTQLAGPNGQLGNGNGEQPAQAPLGTLPAQAAGGLVQ